MKLRFALALLVLPALHRPAPVPAQQTGYVTVSDGARLFYKTSGKPGPGVDTIIAIHGGPGLDLGTIYNDMAEMFGNIKKMAEEAGRDPSTIVMVVHAALEITDKALDKDRAIFSGSLEQISDDVRACAKIGADEVFFDPAFAPGGQSLDRWLSLLDQLRGMMTV